MSKLNNFSEQTVSSFDYDVTLQRIREQDNFNYDIFISKVKSREKESELPIILKALGILYNIDKENGSLFALTHLPSESITHDNLSLIFELKNTDTNIFSIPLDYLEERIVYGESYNLPLLFALSLNGFWGLFTPEQIESKKGRLELCDIVGEESKSLFDRELSTCTYMFENNITIKSVYTSVPKDGLGIIHPLYGELIQYELYRDDKRILVIDKTNNEFYNYQYVLQGLQDSVGYASTTVEHTGEFTTVIESSKNLDYVLVPEYKFIMPCLERMLHDESKHTFPKNIEEEKNPYICVEVIREALSHLVDLGVDIIVFKDFLGYSFDGFKKKYWNN